MLVLGLLVSGLSATSAGLLLQCFFMFLLALWFCKFSMQWLLAYSIFMDKLSFILLMLLIWMFIVLVWISVKYKNFNMQLYLLMLWGLMFCLGLSVLMASMLGFYIFFEMSLIPLFIIVMGWGYQSERIQAAFYLFLYTVVGSLPLLLVFIVLSYTNSSVWFGFSFKGWLDLSLYSLVFQSFVFFGFFVKLPLYGLHLWLPKAHVEAPVSGSMVLAAVLLKLSFYGVFRMLYFFKLLFVSYPVLLSLLLWGGLMGSAMALRQSDMKSLVAFSSIGHMAVMMGGVLLFSWGAVYGAAVMMVAHGFCSSALFYVVNMLYEQNKSRQISVFTGQMFVYSTGFWWFVFLAMNFATPPFMGLMGEILIISCLTSVNLFLVVILLVSSMTAAIFSIFLFSTVIHGKVGSGNSTSLSYDFFNLVCFFHAAPGVILILKLDLFLL